MGSEQNFAPEGQRPITVVLVDDEHLIRAALARALSDGGIELVGEAVTGEDAVAIVVDVRPDVVLMDLRLPGLSGVQAIEQLALLAPASRVLRSEPRPQANRFSPPRSPASSCNTYASYASPPKRPTEPR